MRTDREKIDVLFGAVSQLHFHTIRCNTCEGKMGWRASKQHLAYLVAEIENLYDCLDEPEAQP